MNSLSHADVLRAGAAAYPTRVAVRSEAAGDVTYGELAKTVRHLADALLSIGLAPGDRVVWLSGNRVEYLFAYYATAVAGLIFSPMNYWLRPSEMQPLLELVDPRAAFVDRGYVETFATASEALTDVVRIELPGSGGAADGSFSWTWSALLDRARAEPPWPAAASTGVHEVIFTSGTTGQAKGVMRSQGKRLYDSFAAGLTFKLHRDDHLMSFGPQFHIGGGAVPGPLLLQGGQVTVLARFDPDVAVRQIAAGVTYLQGVPAHFNKLLESGELEGVDVRGVRGVYLGGSLVTYDLFERVQAAFPEAQLAHGYGSTESGPYSIGVRGSALFERPGTIGLPVPGVEPRVVDEAGDDVEAGRVGELLLRGPNIMDGYFRNEALTDEVLDKDGWYRTGDLVSRDDDGYFFVADRKKDMIISGGENVYSREVEDVVIQHPDVIEVAVIGTPDPIFEERVTAVVRVRDAGAPPDPNELISFTRERLAGYKAPKRVEIVQDFPRNSVGKVEKVTLRAMFGSVFATAPDDQPAESP